MSQTVVLLCFLAVIPFAYADQGGFTNSGGSLAGGSSVTSPLGTLTISAGNLSFVTSDGSTVITATFTTSSTAETCSGGGKGGHITCSYTFTGSFSGTLTVSGSAQAINGSTRQVYGTNGVVIAGSTGYNSAYAPFYFSNSGQILRSDDLNGDNLVSYGTQGSGVGQFYGANSIALDSRGRIYVADTYNGRVVRIDDFNGTNWTTFGVWGSGVGQFMDLAGISIDASGRIYVMDTGNNRLVRIDDMNGTNWTAITGLGSGVGQFAQFSAPVAFDSSGRIYVADTGNRRIVRMDDMNATNWVTLTQSPNINGYIYSMQSPIGVAVDPAGRIYIADAESYQPAVIRVDDMTGTNWTSIYLGSGSTPHSIAVDAAGMVLVGGGGAQIVDNLLAVQTSGSALTQYYGPYYVFGATPLPLPSPCFRRLH
jgi:sugar lactone lactonase YvrE